MAIVLTTLTPIFNPVVTFTGNTVTFDAFYYEDDITETITGVQWQLTSNYDPLNPAASSWSNIFSATNNENLGDVDLDGLDDFQSTYTTGALNPGNSGTTYRIRITSSSGEILVSDIYEVNEVPNAFGYRTITVTSNPEIQLSGEEFGDPLKVVSVGGTLAPVSTTFTYSNRPIDSPDDLDPLTISWQVSYNYNPTDQSGTWNTITPPNLFNGTTDVGDATVTIQVIDLGSNQYAKSSTLVLSDIRVGANGAYFRALATSSGVSNSPYTTGSVFQVLVNPEITIVGQPGTNAGDTQSPAFCWGIGNTSNGVFSSETGGDIRILINATSSAGFLSTLAYQWQFKGFSDDQLIGGTPRLIVLNTEDLNDFINIEDGNGLYFNIQTNNNQLRLNRLVYCDRYIFRCIVSGTLEAPVTSNEYTLYLRDGQTLPSRISGSFSGVEDFYGQVVNRQLLTDKPLRSFTFTSGIDTNDYFGQAGSILATWQRLNSGLTDIDVNWTNLSEFTTYTGHLGGEITPNSTGTSFTETYTASTPYLRINESNNITPLDQGARYRLKIQSSSFYTNLNTSTGTRTYTPWYATLNSSGQIVQLQLSREIFILSQPESAAAFSTGTISFAVSATSTSIPSGQSLTYRWQWALLNSSGVPGTFSDLSNGEFFSTTGQTGPTGGVNVVSGTTSTTLIISSVTKEIANYAFRVIVDVLGSIGSVTSSIVIPTIRVDRFTQISSINSLFLSEFETASWSVIATSSSLGTITYQWQKSPNGSTSWTNLINGSKISGATTNSLTITSVEDPEDVGYYRLRLTSLGGEVAFSNVVRLAISIVDINILQDLPNTRSYVEDQQVTTRFFVDAVSTNGELVEYLWQYSRNGGVSYLDFSFGEDFQVNTSNPYTPLPFFKTNDPATSWDSTLVRARLSIPSFGPGVFKFSNVLQLDIRRQFYYFADTQTKIIQIGAPLSIDLDPTWTGPEEPLYEWQYSTNGTTWQSISLLSPAPADGSSVLFAPSVPASWQNYRFRCKITMPLLDDLVYVRNNARQVDTASLGVGFTATVTLSLTNEILNPIFYSRENGKTGCAIGTVICIPKPANFVNDNDTATTDDISRWECSLSGSVLSTQNSSSVTPSGSAYTNNLSYLNRNQNWIETASFTPPKWNLKKDRFQGFIELRGQWLLKSQFPLLYRIIGDEYGSTTTQFKLPNPYGKRLMGTGAINSRNGRVSVIPSFGSNGDSGGDRNKPGSIGGVYLYERSRQLPPGSPGVSGIVDGTAGISDPQTYTLGSFRTDGWEDSENILLIDFVGNFNFRVGPMTPGIISTPSPHVHSGILVGYFDGFKAAADCSRSDCLNTCSSTGNFLETQSASGDLDDGPSNVNTDGKQHIHALDGEFRTAGNNAGANHGEGVGDVSGGATDIFNSNTIDINFSASSSRDTMNSLVEPTTATMSIASRNVFDASLKFYLRNNEQIPIVSDYFRLKWMIKAY
jgi:hypothetical protein